MNMKIKTLSLSLLGLVGFAAGSVMAQTCPTSLTPPWSGLNVGGGTSAASSVTGGYAGTQCRLSSALGNNGAARAQVRDDTPANEARYRAQFLFDPTSMSGTNGTNQADIFLANAPAAFNGLLRLVQIKFSGSGAGTKRLILNGACNNGSTNVCSTVVDLPTQAGPNRVEIDLTVGASGSLRYWVNAIGTSTSDGAPTGTLALTGGNAGWVGVDQAYLGLASPTANYRTINAAGVGYFDQFDSRRQTFIGN